MRFLPQAMRLFFEFPLLYGEYLLLSRLRQNLIGRSFGFSQMRCGNLTAHQRTSKGADQKGRANPYPLNVYAQSSNLLKFMCFPAYTAQTV